MATAAVAVVMPSVLVGRLAGVVEVEVEIEVEVEAEVEIEVEAEAEVDPFDTMDVSSL
jgi:hypothetical protein